MTEEEAADKLRASIRLAGQMMTLKYHKQIGRLASIGLITPSAFTKILDGAVEAQYQNFVQRFGSAVAAIENREALLEEALSGTPLDELLENDALADDIIKRGSSDPANDEPTELVDPLANTVFGKLKF